MKYTYKRLCKFKHDAVFIKFALAKFEMVSYSILFVALICLNNVVHACKSIVLLQLHTNLNFNLTGWKPFEGPEGPKSGGLSAGTDKFGNEVFIGRGYYRDHYAPGKLIVTQTEEYKIGLYVENSVAEQYISNNIEYYEEEPDCNYDWVKSSNGQIVANAVQYTTNQCTFYVGRVFTSNSVEIGKIPLATRTMYYGKGHRTNTYEVLICKKTRKQKNQTTNTSLSPEFTALKDELVALNAQCSKFMLTQMTENQRLFNENASLKTKLNKCKTR